MHPFTWRSRRGLTPGRRAALLAAAAVLTPFVAVVAWAAPRDEVPVPGPDATPEEVVQAYADAINARDFDTASAIDPTADLGRFSRPGQIHVLEMGDAVEGDPDGTHVTVEVDFRGASFALADGIWGYYLQRGDDGLWRIVDQGVS